MASPVSSAERVRTRAARLQVPPMVHLRLPVRQPKEHELEPPAQGEYRLNKRALASEEGQGLPVQSEWSSVHIAALAGSLARPCDRTTVSIAVGAYHCDVLAI